MDKIGMSKEDLAGMAREIRLIESENEVQKIEINNYRNSIAKELKCIKESNLPFEACTRRYPIRKPLVKRFFEWVSRFAKFI